MMRHTVKIIICFALLGFSIMMPAQTLPVFPKDGAVTTGNLTNGITYYLVTNPSMKGVADFALVGKEGLTHWRRGKNSRPCPTSTRRFPTSSCPAKE